MAGPITTFDVKTQGVDHLIDRLKGFEPEVYKVLTREIKAASDIVARAAAGQVPSQALRNWGAWGGRLDYDGGSVAAGFKPAVRTRRTGGQRYVMGLVTQKSAAGAVWQLAGAKSDGPFGQAVTSAWGPATKGYGPRALAPAWRDSVDAARDAIQTAINKAAEAVS